MKTLLDIVPGLELCKLIPAGCFSDSVFAWGTYEDIPEVNIPHLRNCSALERFSPEYPAPTFQEIFDDLRQDSRTYGFVTRKIGTSFMPFEIGFKKNTGNFITHYKWDDNSVNGAMWLWLECHEIAIKETKK